MIEDDMAPVYRIVRPTNSRAAPIVSNGRVVGLRSAEWTADAGGDWELYPTDAANDGWEEVPRASVWPFLRDHAYHLPGAILILAALISWLLGVR